MNEIFLLADKFAFVLIRTSGVLMVAPIFGATAVPMRIKAALVMLVAFVLTPLVPGTPPECNGVIAFGLCGVRELLIGLAMGFIGMVTFGAFQLVGELISTQMGFTMGELADPLMGGQSSTVSQLYYILAMLLFLAINGHHWFLQGLDASFRAVPLGGATLSAALTRGMAEKFAELFAAALKMAAPAMAALLLVTIALGMLARLAPLLNILMMTFSLRIAAGLILMGVSLPYVYKYGKYLLLNMQGDLDRLIKAM